ncbi:MAG TPA: phage major capsid protein [Flavisolibacter sp.]|nr:phage major capsid protein [Flavisolibacter sp.]
MEQVLEKLNEMSTKSEQNKTAIEQQVAELKATFEEKLKVVKDESDNLKDELKQVKAANGRPQMGTPEQPKTFEQQLKAALEEHTDDILKMATKDAGRRDFSIELKAVADMSTSNVTGTLYGQLARPGIIANPNRKVHMRDLLPGGNIGPGNTYTFMKENGEGEGAIAPVAEGATKPQIDLDLIEATVNIETIAGWLRVTRKAMNNIPGFVSFLQARLPEKMLKAEDNLILNGDGVSPNIKGIQVSGNYTAATASQAAAKVEQLLLSIGQLEGMDREATGIVLNTADYYALLTNKAAGSGEYDLPQVVTLTSDGVLRILGIPVVHTTAQTADKYLVGDFRQGAQFLIQEGMRIEFFEQDGTNVRENKITVRIEETVALPVYGATYFVYGDFTA